FVAERHFGRTRVYSAVDGGVVGADRLGHGIDHGLRLLRGGGGIEVAPGGAVGVAEPGEVAPQFLPGTGRGTSRRLVDGALGKRSARSRTPSVSPSGCHLPAGGEDRIGLAHATSPSAASATSISRSRSSSSSSATNASATNARTSSFCANSGGRPRAAM